MKVKVFGGDSHNWSLARDRKNADRFIAGNKETKLSNSLIFSDIYFFVWCNQLLRKKNIFRILKTLFRKKIVVMITNDIRDSEETFSALAGLVDLWVSPNSKISGFLRERGQKFVQIPFYVSPEVFYPLKSGKAEIAADLGIDYGKIKDKLLIGSFQRDSLGTDLNRPKWQKGPELLLEICRRLNKDFILVLAGPRRHFLVNKCREYNIPYVFIGDELYIDRLEDDFHINNLNHEKINLLYNLIDIYIISSSSEGGPKAIMESALTKTLVVSTDVGLAGDFIDEDLLFSKDNLSPALDIIDRFHNDPGEVGRYIEENYNKAIRVLAEDNYTSLYREMFKKLYEG